MQLGDALPQSDERPHPAVLSGVPQNLMSDGRTLRMGDHRDSGVRQAVG
jgi:hypothetical protein